MKSPDETRSFEKGKVEIAKVGENTIGRAHFEPGWSWETCVKPIAKTESLSGSAYTIHYFWQNAS